MAKLTKRLGSGFWNVEHKGKQIKRKLNRAVKNGKIFRFVVINGKKVKAE